MEEAACPGCGSCAGMFTANSMNCLTEAIGMGLPGNGTIPAVHAARIRLAKHAGMKVMELLEKDIKPRDIMTPAAFANALAADMALGCSTNTTLHVPAIAHEAGVPFDLDSLNEISQAHPASHDHQPRNRPSVGRPAKQEIHHIQDLDEAGGILSRNEGAEQEGPARSVRDDRHRHDAWREHRGCARTAIPT